MKANKPGQNSVEPVGRHLGLDEEEQRLGEADDPAIHDVLRGAVARLAPREPSARRVVVVIVDVLKIEIVIKVLKLLAS